MKFRMATMIGALLLSLGGMAAMGGTAHAADPVYVIVPAGTGTVTVNVNGLGCGTTALSPIASTTLALASTCALQGGNVTFVLGTGQQIYTTLRAPAAGGSITLMGLNTTPFAAPVQFSVIGNSANAMVVYTSGSIDQLITGAASVGATGVWAQDAYGTYRVLAINAPAFVNADFRAAFPFGFPTITGVTLTR